MRYYSFQIGGVSIGTDCCGFDDNKPIKREDVVEMADQLRLRKVNGRYIGMDKIKITYLGRDYDRAKAKLTGITAKKDVFEKIKHLLPDDSYTADNIACTDPSNNQFCVRLSEDEYIYYQPDIGEAIINYNEIDDSFKKYAAETFDFDNQNY